MSNDLKSLRTELARLEAAVIELGGQAYQHKTKLLRPGVMSIVGFKSAPSIELVQNVLGPRPSPELAQVFGKLGYEVRRIPTKGRVGAPGATYLLRDDIALALLAVPAKAEIGEWAVIIELTPHKPR